MDLQNQTSPEGVTAPNAKEAPATITNSSITKEELVALTNDAIQKALGPEKANFEKKLSEHEKVNKQYQERLEAVANAAAGKPNSSDRDPLLEPLLRNTSAVIDETVKTAVEEAVRRIRDEDSQQSTIQQTTEKVFAERAKAGLAVTEDDKQVIAGYYLQENSDLPHEERLRNAVKKLDDFIDKIGAGSAEERIKAAASVSGRNASAQSGSQSAEYVDWGKKDAEELLENYNHYAKARNIAE